MRYNKHNFLNKALVKRIRFGGSVGKYFNAPFSDLLYEPLKR